MTLSRTCRIALAALLQGPLYRLSRSHFGRRTKRETPGVPRWLHRRDPVPLVRLITAGVLTRAGWARMVRTGRADRNGAYMMALTPAGRQIARYLQGQGE